MKGIFQAIEEGDLQTIRRIVEADPGLLNNSVGQCGESPLMRAICDMERSFEIIEFLVKSGADVNFATKDGYTPLHFNVDLNGGSGTGEMPYRVARLLKDHGADTEKRNHYGWTPLLRAALEGTEDEFRALLDIGAKYDVEYPGYSMPVFTRGKSLASVAMVYPGKIRALLAAGFKPSLSLVTEAEDNLAEAKDPDSDYANALRESIDLIRKNL
jgi:ankyrin repeat protein